MRYIDIQGARTHNLKNINLKIPRDQLVIITGLSGSGKSSLAFDTLYAEGQRRYVESLSTYARQFLSMMDKPDVDSIEGLSPAISIEQKSTSHNPRSTVGTVTEIYDYLRLLYARVGDPRCPQHGVSLKAQTVSEMVDQVLADYDDRRVQLLAPVIRNRKGEHIHFFDQLRADGYVRVRIDGNIYELDELPNLDKKRNHNIEVVVDRFRVKRDNMQRIADSLETTLALADGLVMLIAHESEQSSLFSSKFACSVCNYSLNEMEPRLFSFNSPIGACKHCDGLGVKQFFDSKKIIPFDEASIAEGVINGWDKNVSYYYQMLKSLALHYDFDLEVPFNQLDEAHKKIILYGSGSTQIVFEYANDKGGTFKRTSRFEGVIPNFERRFKETDSETIRSHLQRYLTTKSCDVCNGSRLCEAALHVFIDSHNLTYLTQLPVADALKYAQQLKLEGMQQQIAEKILKEINARLQFLVDVGLGYLSLDRSAETLSGGEAQRIRLASQIGAGLVGVMYVLDEPSIGLHQRDNRRLISTLTRLRDLGNTVIVVEHDEEAMQHADHIIDIGPGAGVHGGNVVCQGKIEQIKACTDSLTGDYLSGRKKISLPKQKKKVSNENMLTITNASGNNLKNVTLEIPIGLFVCVTGVSGSGKSSLINHTLYPLAATQLNRATTLQHKPYGSISGLDQFINCVNIDQSPIGRTPRSNPATYTGLFTYIRELFAGTEEARVRGYKVGRFSFNVKGGRCELCQGDGVIKVEMHFLADVYVTCEQCGGERYNRETLEITYKGLNIHQVLDMTVENALVFFSAIPMIYRKLQTLADVGLTYIKLGQQATTLSGGEAQRIKLSKELSKRSTGQTLYILDEPTTGLHFYDINLLLEVLHRLRDQGNTVVIIEHNLDVIKTADWIIDLGPEGGGAGGQIIATGTPEQIVNNARSITGQYLKQLLI